MAALERFLHAKGDGFPVLMRAALAQTGKRRNRLFAYDRYLAILSEGTEVT